MNRNTGYNIFLKITNIFKNIGQLHIMSSAYEEHRT